MQEWEAERRVVTPPRSRHSTLSSMEMSDQAPPPPRRATTASRDTLQGQLIIPQTAHPPMSLAAQAAAAGTLASQSAPHLPAPPPPRFVHTQVARLEGRPAAPPSDYSMGSRSAAVMQENEELRRQLEQLRIVNEVQQQEALNRLMEERRRGQAELHAQEERARAAVVGAAQHAQALTSE
jgi:hypothetical protein